LPPAAVFVAEGLGPTAVTRISVRASPGGVPPLVVPENLRSGVSRACWYDPHANPTYQEPAVLPGGPGKPRDKTIV